MPDHIASPLHAFTPEARSRYLEYLLSRLQGHAMTVAEFAPDMRDELERIDALYEPLLREYLGSPLSHDFADRLLSAVSGQRDSEPETVFEGSEGAASEETAPPFVPESRYTILSEIARGGMGTIHRAWDKDLRRVLAIKVIRDVVDGTAAERERRREQLLRRFLREAQITAQLDHPGIVPVHDVGLDASGRVYFTMRLVRGRDLESVLTLARTEEEGWTRYRALETILRVCQTLAYAHSRGVVHRDLKPANIMVGSFGEVYVMDWGLAKIQPEAEEGEILLLNHVEDLADESGTLTEDDLVAPYDTGEGTVLGTPAYMSPEQARGETAATGPATDVYAVGALLYTLLTGHPPYLEEAAKSNSRQILDSIRDGPPRPLNEVLPDLSPRLVSICESAMRRDPESRPRSVDAVGTEITDFLEAEQQAAEDAERAREEATRAEQVASFLTGLFAFAEPGSVSADRITAREILQRGAARIGRELEDQPVLQAHLRETVGRMLRQMGLYEEAQEMLEDVVEYCRARGPSSELATGLHELALVRMARGDFDNASGECEEALELRRQDEAESADVATTLKSLGEIRQAGGDYDSAEALMRDAVAMHRQCLGSDHPELARTLTSLAWLLQSKGTFGEARSVVQNALSILRSALGETHPEVAAAMSQLAAISGAQGDYGASVDLYHQVLELQRRALGDDHPAVATTLNDLAVIKHGQGRAHESEQLYEEALTIFRQRLGDAHPEIAGILNNMGMVLIEGGDLGRAEGVFQEAEEMARQTIGHETPLVAICLNNRARILRRRGDVAEAETLNREALSLFQRILGDEHPYIGRSLTELAWIVRERDPLEAQSHARAALQMRERLFGDDHPDVARSHAQLARLELDGSRVDSAESHLRRAIEILRAKLPPGHWETGESLARLGLLLDDGGRGKEARPILEEARFILNGSRGDQDLLVRVRERLHGD